MLIIFRDAVRSSCIRLLRFSAEDTHSNWFPRNECTFYCFSLCRVPLPLLSCNSTSEPVGITRYPRRPLIAGYRLHSLPEDLPSQETRLHATIPPLFVSPGRCSPRTAWSGMVRKHGNNRRHSTLNRHKTDRQLPSYAQKPSEMLKDPPCDGSDYCNSPIGSMYLTQENGQ